MRIIGIVPFVLALVALILSFLCIFSGSKTSFMTNYPIVTLNTSRIGQNLLNEVTSGNKPSSSGGNFFTNLIHNITSTVTNDINSEVNKLVGSLAHAVGVDDFYSAYVLDYCSGFFVPQPVPNATVPASAIHRNTTYCSPHSGTFNFTPGAALQRTLDETHTGVTLKDLKWPSQIDQGIEDLRDAVKATLVLYCIGVVFAFFTIVASMAWCLSRTDGSRFTPLSLGTAALIGFLALGIASAAITAVSVKASNVINKYGKDISVSASRGNGFLGLSWAATGCMLLASIVGCFGICAGRRRRAKHYT